MKLDFSLRTKLVILSIIPLCCAVGLGLFLTKERVGELNEFTGFQEAMSLANILSDVNEANNNELTDAWCYTPTAEKENGPVETQKIRDRWTESGKKLDQAYATLQTFIQTIDLTKHDPRLKAILGEVDAAKAKLADHRQQMHQTMEYVQIIKPYNELKNRIQSLYPALLNETSDKNLAQKLTAYNLYLDYHSDCGQYTGVMIWAHQVPALPPDGYARFESYYRDSETLLKHFRNLAPADIIAQVDAILNSEQGRWVHEKVTSYLTKDKFFDFRPEKSLEAEFKSKGEARNVELGKLMTFIRADIMNYVAGKISELAFKRNVTISLLVLTIGFSLSFTLYFGSTISRLIVNITHAIAEGTAQVYAASRQITQASDALAHSSCTQAASVEETSAMIAQIQTMTEATSENARKATTLIQDTSKIVSESNLAMADMNKSIKQIKDNSGETKKILRTINDIAFQTNILALNAAVEAARAGEHGAGFAVVADEVRNLAQRSATASSNSNALIESSNQCIDHGAIAAERANATLSRVLSSTDNVSKRIAEIEHDASQQATAINEISQAAAKVDEATHHNAASAEECAASAYSLTEQANNLENCVAQLKEIVYGPRNVDSRHQAEARSPDDNETSPAPPPGDHFKAMVKKPKIVARR